MTVVAMPTGQSRRCHQDCLVISWCCKVQRHPVCHREPLQLSAVLSSLHTALQAKDSCLQALVSHLTHCTTGC